MERIIDNKLASEQISKWGFTVAEVEKLGIMSAHKFSIIYGKDIEKFKFRDLFILYKNIINNPDNYEEFAIWLKKRLDVFIEINAPLRIFAGNQVITRGDKQLETSLQNLSKVIGEFIHSGNITPKRISVAIYYLNLMYK